MCFTKTPSFSTQEEEKVVRKEANASLTKNSQNKENASSYANNLKTTPIGLTDNALTQKKTLLGE